MSAKETSQNKSIHDTIVLLIPAHNEEMVIEDTLRGAIRAGVKPRDIYVVDDSSTDDTYSIATSIISKSHVLQVQRAGKAGALAQAIKEFNLIERYDWVQIVDADSVFSPNYFEEVRKQFGPGVAAVCGQVKSLQNNWITSYRAYEYTVFQDFYKTLQDKFNMVSVMPGPATCFRSSVLAQIEFSTDTLTEDFDMTLQIHHKNLGRIRYAAQAFSWTQDPPTLPIYIKQVNRWYTGSFQVMRKYRLGSRLNPVDIMLLLMTIDGFFYAAQLVVLAIVIYSQSYFIDPWLIFAGDFMIFLVLASYAAIRMKRIDILTPLPTYYVLRFICIGLFIWAAIKVFCLPQSTGGAWNTKRVSHQSKSLELAMKGGDL